MRGFLKIAQGQRQAEKEVTPETGSSGPRTRASMQYSQTRPMRSSPAPTKEKPQGPPQGRQMTESFPISTPRLPRSAASSPVPDDEYETPQVKLKNALYGLKDSPKAWGHLMRRFLARQKILQRTEEAGIMAEFEHTSG